jgi:hypothetical protein
MNYDIIGDIHGHADALVALLNKMGYREKQGAWRHPERMAIFVGDFIDRGPKQVASVMIARRMVEAGSALAIMGNHEFNAIAWYARDPDNRGDYLRPHFSEKYGVKNYAQHMRFLAEVDREPKLHSEIIDWFLTLPLWLDLPGLRVVHACWHESLMTYLKPRLDKGQRLDWERMVDASREPDDEAEKDTANPSVFKAVEALIKGIEIPLPPPYSFLDKDGNTRRRVRVRWWDAQALTYRQAALVDDELREQLPETPIPEHARIGYSADKPLFVGHYWLMGEPKPLSAKVACVDYSAARGGPLCAYRWEGETELRPDGFCYHGALKQ